MTAPEFVERRKEDRPETGEAPFVAGEVFFTRTDRRGVIQAGNYIFRRVSNFDWDEMIGAPHKLIRHPDMPQAVFHLMWSRILAGQPFGAYVKNRAKDGLYYWVYAVVAPWQDGFVSARIKPTSGRLAMVEALYGELRASELEAKCSPEDSAARLVERLKEAGFATYQQFQTDALAEELLAEGAALGMPPDERITRSRELLSATAGLGEHTQHMFEEFTSLMSVPQNMQIKAFRLEPTGGPITALSKTYGHMSTEISTWFSENVVGEDNTFTKISESVTEALFLNSTAEILQRCHRQIRNERRRLGDTEMEQERDYLSDLALAYWRQAKEASTKVSGEAARISQACKDMHRNLLGLNTVCVTCKIENARLGAEAGSLDEIVSQLEMSQSKIESRLNDIHARAEMVRKHASSCCWSEAQMMSEDIFGGKAQGEFLKSA